MPGRVDGPVPMMGALDLRALRRLTMCDFGRDFRMTLGWMGEVGPLAMAESTTFKGVDSTSNGPALVSATEFLLFDDLLEFLSIMVDLLLSSELAVSLVHLLDGVLVLVVTLEDLADTLSTPILVVAILTVSIGGLELAPFWALDATVMLLLVVVILVLVGAVVFVALGRTAVFTPPRVVIACPAAPELVEDFTVVGGVARELSDDGWDGGAGSDKRGVGILGQDWPVDKRSNDFLRSSNLLWISVREVLSTQRWQYHRIELNFAMALAASLDKPPEQIPWWKLLPQKPLHLMIMALFSKRQALQMVAVDIFSVT